MWFIVAGVVALFFLMRSGMLGGSTGASGTSDTIGDSVPPVSIRTDVPGSFQPPIAPPPGGSGSVADLLRRLGQSANPRGGGAVIPVGVNFGASMKGDAFSVPKAAPPGTDFTRNPGVNVPFKTGATLPPQQQKDTALLSRSSTLGKGGSSLGLTNLGTKGF